MLQRVGPGRLAGVFVFDLRGEGGTLVFHPRREVSVTRLMALDLPEEIATSIWHVVETYDPETELLGLVVDRSERPLLWSLVRGTPS